MLKLHDYFGTASVLVASAVAAETGLAASTA